MASAVRLTCRKNRTGVASDWNYAEGETLRQLSGRGEPPVIQKELDSFITRRGPGAAMLGSPACRYLASLSLQSKLAAFNSWLFRLMNTIKQNPCSNLTGSRGACFVLYAREASAYLDRLDSLFM